MSAIRPDGSDPLTEQVAESVRRQTYGRVRNLQVERTLGRVEVRGEVRTWHVKQQALQAALEMLSGEQLLECIIVIGAEAAARRSAVDARPFRTPPTPLAAEC